jgi:hypothetical protein
VRTRNADSPLAFTQCVGGRVRPLLRTRSHRSRKRGRTSPRRPVPSGLRPRGWTRLPGPLAASRPEGSEPKSPSWTWANDLGPVYDGFEARGCHPVIPLRETPAVKAGKHRPPVCEHDGRPLPEPTPSGRRPSGAAQPASAPRQADGSGPAGCTRSSAGLRCAGRSSTSSMAPSSGRTASSRTSGRCCRCGYAVLSGSRCTPT